MTRKILDTKNSHFCSDKTAVIKRLGKDFLLDQLRWMMLIRNLETRAEAAYLQGKVGGFFHAYIGQEAIQTAAVAALGQENWWATSYRCHALALLLGASPEEIMSEFYGRATGNAQGRGGSMHLYTDRLMGGSGIVGGQIPMAIGAAFSQKYRGLKSELTFCFMGDGATAQGTFHESLNLASLWNLPCIFVVESNNWGMGTATSRAICVDDLAAKKGPSFDMPSYVLDGMDFFDCHEGFLEIGKEVMKSSRPALVEARTERFKGHSVSDPGLYRSKECLGKAMTSCPIVKLSKDLQEAGFIDEAGIKKLDKEQKQICVEAMKAADAAPWPEAASLEDGVLAP